MDLDPIELFKAWYADAERDESTDAEVAALATAAGDARPSVRMVLFRGFREGGLSFFTNYESRKGRELAANPFAAMVFHWPHLGRQLRVEGSVERLSPEESDAYFQARPFESRITALISRQSRPLDDSDDFDVELTRLEGALRGKRVERPDNWGGFKIIPNAFEFWSQGEHRRHRRVRYEKTADGWSAVNLYP
jgi:pyridoxamine 5'-phosphate oxidase